MKHLPTDLLRVFNTKQVSADRFDSRWDKSKTVVKEKTCKVAFRHQDATLHFAVSHIVHNDWKTSGLCG